MRVRSTAAVAVLTVAVGVALAGPASAADLDCDDFPNQAAAQTVLVADPRDPNGLDANDNGQACEAYAYGSAATTPGQVAARPAGAVPAGDGSAAGREAPADGSSLRYVLGGMAFAVAGGAAVAGRRASRA